MECNAEMHVPGTANHHTIFTVVSASRGHIFRILYQPWWFAIEREEKRKWSGRARVRQQFQQSSKFHCHWSCHGVWLLAAWRLTGLHGMAGFLFPTSSFSTKLHSWFNKWSSCRIVSITSLITLRSPFVNTGPCGWPCHSRSHPWRYWNNHGNRWIAFRDSTQYLGCLTCGQWGDLSTFIRIIISHSAMSTSVQTMLSTNFNKPKNEQFYEFWPAEYNVGILLKKIF